MAKEEIIEKESKDEYIIELNNVCKKYENSDVYAVENFNLKIKKGEFVTFLGPSGCGKTTTLRMIAGFELPTSGQILLNGKDISLLPPYKRPINTVFQKYALFAHLNIYNNIAFGLKLKKIPYQGKNIFGKEVTKYKHLSKQEIDQKVKNALKIVDLEGFEKRDITTLSGGQQQRIAIARAIVNEPEILLLDEPLGALDLKMRKEMQLELKEMHKKLGITFIYVTHDQEEALTMSDTIVVINDGEIQQVGTPKGIYDEPKNAFVADFIGESNIYTGTMFKDHKVRFLNKLFDCVDNFEPNQKVDVVVRPEDVILLPKDKGIVNGKVVSKIFKGMHFEYIIMVGKSELIAQSTKELEEGIEIGISVEPNNIQIMAKPFTSNFYEGYLTSDYKVCFADKEFDYDVLSLFPGCKFNEDNVLVDAKNNPVDVEDKEVVVDIPFEGVSISDEEGFGQFEGNIISMIYHGDHYQVIVRNEDEEDFVLDTPDLWNENDKVSVKIDPSFIHVKLKVGDKSHA